MHEACGVDGCVVVHRRLQGDTFIVQDDHASHPFVTLDLLDAIFYFRLSVTE